MNVFELMAAHIDDRFTPDPNRPARWIVIGDKALMDWDELGGMYTRPSLDPDKPGSILVVVKPPPLVLLIEALHAEGWRRGGWCDHDFWELYAYLRDGDAEIRVRGTVPARHYPDHDTMIPFWAPSAPAISRRRSFKTEYDDWQAGNRDDRW